MSYLLRKEAKEGSEKVSEHPSNARSEHDVLDEKVEEKKVDFTDERLNLED